MKFWRNKTKINESDSNRTAGTYIEEDEDDEQDELSSQEFIAKRNDSSSYLTVVSQPSCPNCSDFDDDNHNISCSSSSTRCATTTTSSSSSMTVRTLKESLDCNLHTSQTDASRNKRRDKRSMSTNSNGTLSTLSNTNSSYSSGSTSHGFWKEQEATSNHERCRKSHTRMNMVQFTNVYVKYYVMTIGDSPSVTEGCPLTIEWEPIGISHASVDEFERVRQPQRRDFVDILLDSKTRHAILFDAGYSQEEITKAASSSCAMSQKLRRNTMSTTLPKNHECYVPRNQFKKMNLFSNGWVPTIRTNNINQNKTKKKKDRKYYWSQVEYLGEEQKRTLNAG